MIDVTKVKAGAKVKLEDGETGTVRGSYMSSTGIILTVKTSPGSIVDRNVPLEKVVEVLDA